MRLQHNHVFTVVSSIAKPVKSGKEQSAGLERKATRWTDDGLDVDISAMLQQRIHHIHTTSAAGIVQWRKATLLVHSINVLHHVEMTLVPPASQAGACRPTTKAFYIIQADSSRGVILTIFLA